jgi:hypothetical protein
MTKKNNVFIRHSAHHTYWYFFCTGSFVVVAAVKNTKEEKVIGTCTTGMGDYNIFNLSGNGINYQCYDNFKFQKDGFINLLPVSDSINSGIDLLKSSFEKNPNQKINDYWLLHQR